MRRGIVILLSALCLAGCGKKEDKVIPRQELKQYEVQTEMKPELFDEYFSVSYEKTEDVQTDPPLYIMILKLKEGYFPADDFKLTLNGFSEKSVYSFNWKTDPVQVYVPVYDVYEDQTAEAEAMSGHLLSYEIPSKYLKQDENGTYFRTDLIENKCYLNGTLGYEDEEGNTEVLHHIWWPNILREE